MARVIVLAGPSGSGKSHLAAGLDLPVLRLDDFYRDGDDPSLPSVALAGGEPIIDWDDPASWHCDDAVAAIEELCTRGYARVPVYDLSSSRRTGTQMLDLDGAGFFVAEGIFAQEVIGSCAERGLLAQAVCVTQHPAVTAVRRLARDLSEHRKPPGVLVRRGLHLMRRQRRIVAQAQRLGAEVMTPEQAAMRIGRLVEAAAT